MTSIPHPDDIAAGANLRRIRNHRGMSQEALAAHLHITFQQVQKYEKGTNRLSISRALMACRALSCTLQDLVPGTEDNGDTALDLPLRSPQANRMADIFDRIPDTMQRHYLMRLAATMAGPAMTKEITEMSIITHPPGPAGEQAIIDLARQAFGQRQATAE
ncbi:helix-turn-helix transcriptional regulator [Rhizobium cremeum]|uniref:helix-turn-helix domain-containing protein n=1 Tax=Rhizobium cremeum TaxID=2813827 RepID=UPI000DDCA710|nr:helix-turn-helix transcriptional regulator [Rhizobium cremeum]MCJ7993252.1 helix-turn-helix transcriptional regulator [Rhizobium cremeum]MCJ7998317.1 helix-turn-helix transcriptional regulator [Rhizobium cremeum]